MLGNSFLLYYKSISSGVCLKRSKARKVNTSIHKPVYIRLC